MVTFTTGGSYDYKTQKLIEIRNLTGIITEQLDNEYETNIYEWLEESSLKETFRPRTTECVDTYIINTISHNFRHFIVVSGTNYDT